MKAKFVEGYNIISILKIEYSDTHKKPKYNFKINKFVVSLGILNN